MQILANAQQIQVLLLGIFGIFFLDIFYLLLVQFLDLEPVNMEDQLYYEPSCKEHIHGYISP